LQVAITLVMLNLILFGPPGSGKGTQAAILKAKYGLEHISTGDLLREERANKTPLGLEAQKFMEQGLLVPDSVVIGMIDNKLVERSALVNGFIFDGFPRTVAQAQALDALLAARNTQIAGVLALQVSDEELLKRLLNRGLTSGREDDRNPEVIGKRIVVYNNSTIPVLDYYGLSGKSLCVNGEGSIDDITYSLTTAIDGINAKA
jgi:adenylate kinase